MSLFGEAAAVLLLGALILLVAWTPSRLERVPLSVPMLCLAIGAGLVIGKQAGIFGSIVLADRLGIARKPADSSWLQIWGTAILCGIGFTMSLFIGALAFPRDPALIEEAKLGILGGSLISAMLGYCVLRLAPAGRAPRG